MTKVTKDLNVATQNSSSNSLPTRLSLCYLVESLLLNNMDGITP